MNEITEVARVFAEIESLCSQLPASGKLPTTVELAEKLNTSAFTVNQAIKKLVKQGKLRTVTGKGIFLCDQAFSKSNLSSYSAFPGNASMTTVRFSPQTTIPEELETWDTIVKMFSKLMPQTKVELTGHTPQDLKNNDVQLISSWQVASMIESGMILNLSPYVTLPDKKDDYFPGCWSFHSCWPGQWWIPLWMNTSVSVYQRKHLQDLGLTPLSGENSLDDLTEHYQQIKKAIQKRHLKVSPGWNLLGYAGFIATEGIELFPENLLLDESQATRKLWCSILRKIKIYAGMHTETIQATYREENLRDRFYQGKGVMLLDGTLQEEMLRFSGSLVIRPAVRGGQVFGAAGLVVAKKTPNPVAVGYFLSFLLSAEAQKILAESGKTPVHRSCLNSTKMKLPRTLSQEEVIHFHENSYIPKIKHWIQVEILRQVIDPEINWFLTNDRSEEQTVASILSKANHLVKHILELKLGECS